MNMQWNNYCIRWSVLRACAAALRPGLIEWSMHDQCVVKFRFSCSYANVQKWRLWFAQWSFDSYRSSHTATRCMSLRHPQTDAAWNQRLARHNLPRRHRRRRRRRCCLRSLASLSCTDKHFLLHSFVCSFVCRFAYMCHAKQPSYPAVGAITRAKTS